MEGLFLNSMGFNENLTVGELLENLPILESAGIEAINKNPALRKEYEKAKKFERENAKVLDEINKKNRREINSIANKFKQVKVKDLLPNKIESFSKTITSEMDAILSDSATKNLAFKILPIDKIKKEVYNLKNISKEDFNEIMGVILYISILNMVASLIFGSLTGSTGIGILISGVLIAPVTEEFGKAWAIESNLSYEFATIFNALEFADYFIRLVPKIGIIGTIKARIPAIILHYSTTITQKFISQKSIFRHNKFVGKLLGFVAGSIIHGMWNYGSISRELRDYNINFFDLLSIRGGEDELGDMIYNRRNRGKGYTF